MLAAFSVVNGEDTIMQAIFADENLDSRMTRCRNNLDFRLLYTPEDPTTALHTAARIPDQEPSPLTSGMA